MITGLMPVLLRLCASGGRRGSRIIGSTETWMVYGLDGELVAEYAPNGAAGSPQKEYGYRGGQMLIVAQTSPLEIRWTVPDHLGTPRMNIMGNGASGGLLSSVRRHDYLPFGEELVAGVGLRSSSSHGYEPPSDSVRQKFGSKERDMETGLDYFGARYFTSAQGRFASIDPLEIVFEPSQIKYLAYLSNPQNWNRYGYVLNNPIALTDPDGREPNKAQAGTVQQIVAVIQQIERDNPGASRTDILERTARHFEGMIDNAPGSIRYVYTKNSGWIDAKHFFAAAETAASYGELATNVGGLFIEVKQTLERNESAFSYEDLGSNAAGADFGDDVFNPNGGGLVSEQVANYFNGTLGALSPQAAPNFNQLPAAADTPGQGSRASQTTSSRTTSTQSTRRSANGQSQSATGSARNSTSNSAGQACPDARCKPKSSTGSNNSN